MAEWKKVIVSGSAAVLSQVNVGTTQQITNSQATTFLTGSFKGDGSGLTGILATSLDIDTFGSDLTSQTIVTADKLPISDGGTEGRITVGQLATPLAGTGLEANAGTLRIATGVVTSAMITDDTIVNADINSAAGILYSKLNLGSSTIHSGSYFGGIAVVSGSSQITYSGLTGVPAGIVSGSSQVLAGTTIHSGSFFNGITVVSGSSQISYTGLSNTPVGIVSGSTLAAGSGQGTHTLTTNGVSSGDVAVTGLGTAGTPTFAGLTITNGNIAINNGTSTAITTTGATATVFNTNANTVNAFGAATILNLGHTTGTTTVNNNLSVLGTLYVQGSVTAISSSNLYVADQFILLASGSVGDTDGGIIIDRGSYSSGNIAFGYDAGQDRWGYQNGLVDTTNAIDTTSASGVSGSFAGYVFTEAAHTATKPTTGEFVKEGAIYTNTNGDIWMYA